MPLNVQIIMSEKDKLEIAKQALRDIYNTPVSDRESLRHTIGLIKSRVVEAFNAMNP